MPAPVLLHAPPGGRALHADLAARLLPLLRRHAAGGVPFARVHRRHREPDMAVSVEIHDVATDVSIAISGRRIRDASDASATATARDLAIAVLEAVLRPVDEATAARLLRLNDGVVLALADATGSPPSSVRLKLAGADDGLSASIWSPDRAELATWTAGPEHDAWSPVRHVRAMMALRGRRHELTILETPWHDGPVDPDAMHLLRAAAELPPAPAPVVPDEAWGPPF